MTRKLEIIMIYDYDLDDLLSCALNKFYIYQQTDIQLQSPHTINHGVVETFYWLLKYLVNILRSYNVVYYFLVEEASTAFIKIILREAFNK